MTETRVIEKPQCISNMDEKGYKLNLYKQQTVFAEKAACANAERRAGEYAENVRCLWKHIGLLY